MAELKWTREKLDELIEGIDNAIGPCESRYAGIGGMIMLRDAILAAQENLLDPPECPTNHGVTRPTQGYAVYGYHGFYKFCPDCGQPLGEAE